MVAGVNVRLNPDVFFLLRYTASGSPSTTPAPPGPTPPALGTARGPGSDPDPDPAVGGRPAAVVGDSDPAVEGRQDPDPPEADAGCDQLRVTALRP